MIPDVGVLGVILALALYGDEARAPRATIAAGLLLVVALCRPPAVWLSRPSGKLAVALAAASLLLARPASIEAASALFLGTFKYLAVIVLLLCIPLLRLPFLRGRLDAVVVRYLHRVPAAHRLRAVLAAAVVMTTVLSLGTVGVLGALLKGRSQPELAAPRMIMRAVVATMLWAPTTAAVAVVMNHFPQISWASALPLGVPISIGALAIAAFERGSVASEAAGLPPGSGAARTLWILGAALAAMTSLAHLGGGLSLTNAVSVSAIAVLVLWFAAFERLPLSTADAPGPRAGEEARDVVTIVHEHASKSFAQASPEIALFLASGLFAAALRGLNADAPIAAVAGAGPWASMALVVFGVPLITSIGIHPIVPFSVLASALTPAALGTSEVGLYTVWVVAFMLCMLVSPVSVLSVTAAASFEIPTARIGLRAHWKYAMAVGMLGMIVVRLLG